MDAGAAIRLRIDLDEAGLIDASVVREQGSVKEYAIRLTPHGREVGELIVALDVAIQKQNRKESRGRK